MVIRGKEIGWWGSGDDGYATRRVVKYHITCRRLAGDLGNPISGSRKDNFLIEGAGWHIGCRDGVARIVAEERIAMRMGERNRRKEEEGRRETVFYMPSPTAIIRWLA